jgi:hypothetical protein
LSLGVTDPATKTQHSGSSTTWYLSADGSEAPTVEFGYIDTPNPTVESFELQRGSWGLGFKIKADFGAKALDYRALHRSEA